VLVVVGMVVVGSMVVAVVVSPWRWRAVVEGPWRWPAVVVGASVVGGPVVPVVVGSVVRDVVAPVVEGVAGGHAGTTIVSVDGWVNEVGLNAESSPPGAPVASTAKRALVPSGSAVGKSAAPVLSRMKTAKWSGILPGVRPPAFNEKDNEMLLPNGVNGTSSSFKKDPSFMVVWCAGSTPSIISPSTSPPWVSGTPRVPSVEKSNISTTLDSGSSLTMSNTNCPVFPETALVSIVTE
jgi:hypothetical protein